MCVHFIHYVLKVLQSRNFLRDRGSDASLPLFGPIFNGVVPHGQ